MFRATTPTHIFTLPFNTGQLQEIRITYQQNDETVLQKTEADCTLAGNEIKVTLTQEETLLFAPDERVSIDGVQYGAHLLSELYNKKNHQF